MEWIQVKNYDSDRTRAECLVYDPISDRFIDLGVDDLDPISAKPESLRSDARAAALDPWAEVDGTRDRSDGGAAQELRR